MKEITIKDFPQKNETIYYKPKLTEHQAAIACRNALYNSPVFNNFIDQQVNKTLSNALVFAKKHPNEPEYNAGESFDLTEYSWGDKYINGKNKLLPIILNTLKSLGVNPNDYLHKTWLSRDYVVASDELAYELFALGQDAWREELNARGFGAYVDDNVNLIIQLHN